MFGYMLVTEPGTFLFMQPCARQGTYHHEKRLPKQQDRSQIRASSLYTGSSNARVLESLHRLTITMCGMASDVQAKRFTSEILDRLSSNVALQMRRGNTLGGGGCEVSNVETDRALSVSIV